MKKMKYVLETRNIKMCDGRIVSEATNNNSFAALCLWVLNQANKKLKETMDQKI